MKYREFVSNIFNKLSPIQKHELFYFSLFDPSSWEESGRYFDVKEVVDRRAVDLVKVNSKFHRKLVKSKTEKARFLTRFVYTGDLCCFMLAAALNEKGFPTHPKLVLPDLIVIAKGEEIGVEIKRLVSCVNLKERIMTDIVEPLKKEKWKKKLKLLLLFPQLGKEDPHRIQQIIEGFYSLEDWINEHVPVETKLLCRYVEEEHRESSKYSFGGLINDLSGWV